MEIWPQIETLSREQEMEILNLKWLLFPILFVGFFKINRIKAIAEMNKLCKFHENLTKKEDFIA